MLHESENFYLSLSEPYQGCMLALRNIILKLDDDMQEATKWNSPCFYYGEKMLCMLQFTKKNSMCYILMIEGLRLNNPHLEKGGRKRMKHLEVNPNEDLPLDIINEILNEGLELFQTSDENYLSLGKKRK